MDDECNIGLHAHKVQTSLDCRAGGKIQVCFLAICFKAVMLCDLANTFSKNMLGPLASVVLILFICLLVHIFLTAVRRDAFICTWLDSCKHSPAISNPMRHCAAARRKSKVTLPVPQMRCSWHFSSNSYAIPTCSLNGLCSCFEFITSCGSQQ